VSVHITLEFTPNPHTLKYVVSRPLLERGAFDFTAPEQAAQAPLAARLFEVPGVAGVMIATDFITITVTGAGVMMDVNAALPGIIVEHLEADRPVIEAGLQVPEHALDDSAVAQQIKTLLDEQIRPAVAMDGGDIIFERFDEGVVYLELKGACAGCPSSMATLKMGIEQHLREQIPEVLEVRAV